MRPNRIKRLWREGKPVVVGWLFTADPYVVETMAHAGFDALVLDMQHGAGIGPDRPVTALQAISTTDTVPLVRVPWNDPVYIQYALDAGAYGVIVPLVNSRADAERAVDARRFPPLGNRSIGANRAHLYAGADYFAQANDEIVCLVMVEHVDAVERVDEIVTTPGIDGVYIGPSDLAASLGLPPGLDVQDSRHLAACQRVLDASLATGVVAGMHCAGPDEAKRRFAQGFHLCTIGVDVRFVAAGARAALDGVRGT
ncbi:MAG: 2,4-dihydroxyhept-2-ene-1,7-dioic acid aldolase [Chloroflexi bacterium]|nr:2,4-dihydroxyhept-2-ene-1,7-dioic acid aldolase [Chloroflexota bacterium]